MSRERDSMIMKTFASKNECKLLRREGRRERMEERRNRNKEWKE